jgi:hypothetical protein
MHPEVTTQEGDIARDLVFGARAIGSTLGLTPRQVYHAAAHAHLPTFKIGGTICARKSTLMAWFSRLEEPAGAAPADRQGD